MFGRTDSDLTIEKIYSCCFASECFSSDVRIAIRSRSKHHGSCKFSSNLVIGIYKSAITNLKSE